jgi:hypothetical protein
MKSYMVSLLNCSGDGDGDRDRDRDGSEKVKTHIEQIMLAWTYRPKVTNSTDDALCTGNTHAH